MGPMDHSYREASSEFAEAPPSTIQMRGRRGPRHFGDNQPIDHNAPPPGTHSCRCANAHLPVCGRSLHHGEGTGNGSKTRRQGWLHQERKGRHRRSSPTAKPENKPALIVFDLNNANAKPLTLIPKLKTKLKRSAAIIGFLSSIQGDLKAKAVEAGCGHCNAPGGVLAEPAESAPAIRR